MTGLGYWLNRISVRVDLWARRLAKGMLLLLLLILLLQVVARYLLASPPTWTEEIGKLLMVWSGLLGASAAFRLRCDVIMVRLPDKGGWLSWTGRLIRFAGVLLFCGTVLWFSPSFLVRSLGTDFFGIEGLPVIWASAAIPVFMVLVLLHALAHLSAPLPSAGEAIESETIN